MADRPYGTMLRSARHSFDSGCIGPAMKGDAPLPALRDITGHYDPRPYARGATRGVGGVMAYGMKFLSTPLLERRFGVVVDDVGCLVVSIHAR